MAQYQYKKTYKKAIYLLLLANILILSQLFRGKNTPQHYLKYSKELKQKQQTYNNIAHERYRIEHSMQLLSNPDKNDDLLDEYLRQFLQLSAPDENIVLLKEH
ncbi:MAG: hypothetical protein IJT15_03735 [Rickettsiales bacterium]|nr:hypothetical protein [Rickettsiales bacterium]